MFAVMKKLLYAALAVFIGITLLTIQHGISQETEVSGLKGSLGQEQRIESLITRYEKAAKRLEGDLDRYETILATWEKQQKQYQTC